MSGSSQSPLTLFERYAKAHPNQTTAFTFVDAARQKSLSRNEIFTSAATEGQQLKNFVEPGAVVAILASTQERQVGHVLSALAAGAVPAVMTPPNRKLHADYYAKTTASILASVAPALLITDVSNVIDELPKSCTVVDNDINPISHGKGSDRRPPDGTAFVQFSSGTTGIKKAVAVSQSALIAQLETYGQALALSPSHNGGGDCFVNWLPLYHDMGYITALHLALYAGVHSVMLDPIDWVSKPATYVEALTQYRGTHSWNPNFAYAFMADRVSDTLLSDLDLSSVRSLVNCSEPVTAAAQHRFTEKFATAGLSPDVMTGCYAMAETTFAVTHGSNTDSYALDNAGPIDGGTLKQRLPIISVGTALPEVEISIRSENGDEVPDRVIGEIHISAPFLATGYPYDETATAASFDNGTYQTGDLGYRIGEQIYVSGRAKDLLIVAGHNVFPEDIERIVGELDGVAPGRVAAFARFDERNQTDTIIVCAEPVSDEVVPDLLPARQRLLAELAVSAAIHLVPKGFLVKSTSGKISRSATAQLWLDSDTATEPKR